ncbi:MAG: GHKL domain-containing protein [Nitrospirae bacterium]|nr:GHKL domain-containing protein [Nitrospirota bacterium]
MNILHRSLKQKVILGYFIGLVLMTCVVLVNWNNLDSVKDIVQSGEKVSDLFDTTLEIRRYEKNYFLYRENEDYSELLIYVGKAEELIKENSKELNLFSKLEVISELRDNIREYRSLLEVLPSLHSIESRRVWQEKLREKGRTIVTTTEEMSTTERKIMQATLQTSGNMLIASMVFLISAGFIIGAIFFRMFIKPLRLLERQMKGIANGEFSFIPVVSRDRELMSLSKAFNTMLVELELRQMHLVQTEKLASLGTLLFGVAHELNNPLSNISTSCQILKEEIDEADIGYKKELLSQIESETDRAKDILRSLLDYSRTGEKKTINLKKTVSESIRFIGGEAPAKVEIDLNIHEDLELFADKQQLQQVFLNFIKNAMEAIEGEGRISISARKVKDTVEIKVSDTGKGMEPEILSKIFDPFFTTKIAKKGYGLGLFVVHNIISEHGGTIDVESSPGHGTTFLIKLPVKELKDEK